MSKTLHPHSNREPKLQVEDGLFKQLLNSYFPLSGCGKFGKFFTFKRKTFFV